MYMFLFFLVYILKHGQCPVNSGRIRYFLRTVVFVKNNTENFFNEMAIDASVSTGFVFSGYRLGYFVQKLL